MCLLDEVIGWDAERITCTSSSHRSVDNPLRARGRLGIACGIEYAAQAMAVHAALIAALEAGRGVAGSLVAERAAAELLPAGSLTQVSPTVASAPGSPVAESPMPVSAAVGLLAGVRGVQFHVSRLDDVKGDLICDAVRVAGDPRTALYEFELRSGTTLLLLGRATVVLDATGRLP
jgi:predicted hotdog family 3-hydroxylacyl-ACP dehydratase